VGKHALRQRLHGNMVTHGLCGDSRPRLSSGAKLRVGARLGELALAGQPRRLSLRVLL
jgi:hypothetical protein